MADQLLTEDDVLSNIRFQEALKTATPKVFVTYALIAMNVLYFVWMVAHGVSFFEPTTGSLVRWGADFGPITLGGEWWRTLSSTFVHIGIIHLAMNMYVFFSVGVFTERLFGNISYIVLYLLTGIAGSLLSLALHPDTVSAGASGAVFGVCGGLLAYILIRRESVPAQRAKAIGRSFITFIAINLVWGLSQHVDMAAHAGGFVSGFLVGCALARPIGNGSEGRGSRALVIGVLGMAVLVLCAHRLPAGDKARAQWMRSVMTAPAVTIGSQDEVRYAGSATKGDATAFGNKLKTDGLFQDRGALVLLSKDPGGTTVSFAVTDKWDSSNTEVIDLLSHEVASAVDGKPLKVRFFGPEGKLKKEVLVR